MDQANHELSKNVRGFAPEAARILLEYSWPGNVRELKNTIRRGVLLAESELIQTGDLSLDMNLFHHESNITGDNSESGSIEKATRQIEKELIIEALEKTGGNKIKAAELLKMNRKTLYRKIKSLGLQ